MKATLRWPSGPMGSRGLNDTGRHSAVTPGELLLLLKEAMSSFKILYRKAFDMSSQKLSNRHTGEAGNP